MKCLSQTIDLGKEDNLSILSQKKKKKNQINEWWCDFKPIFYL